MRDNDMYMYSQNRFLSGNPLQNRAQYGFEMVTSAQYKQFHEMKSEMPSDVLELFKGNQIGFLKAPVKRKCRQLDPVAALKMNLTEMFAIPNLELVEEKRQTKAERAQRIVKQRKMNNQKAINQKIQEWDPFEAPRATSDPERTLFVSRLSYKTTQKDLKHEFERYGLIKSVVMPVDKEGKSRGYGFVEFETKQDFNHAYKNANQRKVAGRRILVDFERGRALLNWRPRRFGGGLGDNRLTKEEAKKRQEQAKRKREVKATEKKSHEKSRSRQKRDKKVVEEKDRERGRRDNRDNRDYRDRRDVRDTRDGRDRRRRDY